MIPGGTSAHMDIIFAAGKPRRRSQMTQGGRMMWSMTLNLEWKYYGD